MSDTSTAINSEPRIPLGQSEEKILRRYSAQAQHEGKKKNLIAYRNLRKEGVPHSKAMGQSIERAKHVNTPADMIKLAQARERLAKAKAA